MAHTVSYAATSYGIHQLLFEANIGEENVQITIVTLTIKYSK